MVRLVRRSLAGAGGTGSQQAVLFRPVQTVARERQETFAAHMAVVSDLRHAVLSGKPQAAVLLAQMRKSGMASTQEVQGLTGARGESTPDPHPCALPQTLPPHLRRHDFRAIFGLSHCFYGTASLA